MNSLRGSACVGGRRGEGPCGVRVRAAAAGMLVCMAAASVVGGARVWGEERCRPCAAPCTARGCSAWQSGRAGAARAAGLHHASVPLAARAAVLVRARACGWRGREAARALGLTAARAPRGRALRVRATRFTALAGPPALVQVGKQHADPLYAHAATQTHTHTHAHMHCRAEQQGRRAPRVCLEAIVHSQRAPPFCSAARTPSASQRRSPRAGGRCE